MKGLRFFMVLALAAAVVAGSCASRRDCPKIATSIRLPKDEAPHAVATEWWYYTGHLFTEAQRRFGFEFTIFQVVINDLRGYVGHFAVSDIEKGRYVFDQRLEIKDTLFESFNLNVGDWILKGDGKVDRIKAGMNGYGIDISASSSKPAAIHGDQGLIDMGGASPSYYYSKTRLAIQGTLTLDDLPQAVAGSGWSDHQWGDFIPFDSKGWDWFSLQLDDGTEVMAFFLHFKDGQTRLTGGTIVNADGCQKTFSQIQVTPKATWQSPHTQAIYPMGWDIQIPEEDLVVSLVPVFEDQEFNSLATTMNVYWEGEVEISGSHDQTPVNGLGYVELAGYGPWGADRQRKSS